MLSHNLTAALFISTLRQLILGFSSPNTTTFVRMCLQRAAGAPHSLLFGHALAWVFVRLVRQACPFEFILLYMVKHQRLWTIMLISGDLMQNVARLFREKKQNVSVVFWRGLHVHTSHCVSVCTQVVWSKCKPSSRQYWVCFISCLCQAAEKIWIKLSLIVIFSLLYKTRQLSRQHYEISFGSRGDDLMIYAVVLKVVWRQFFFNWTVYFEGVLCEQLVHTIVITCYNVRLKQ